MRAALQSLALGSSLALGLFGCSGDKVCSGSNCEPVAGSYSLTFIGSKTQTGTCTGVEPLAEGTLVVSGTGSSVTGSFGAFTDLNGTLYQSGTLSMLGNNSAAANLGDGGTTTGATSTLTFSLKYVSAAGTSPTELNGTATQIDAPGNTSASSCTQTANVTAAQE